MFCNMLHQTNVTFCAGMVHISLRGYALNYSANADDCSLTNALRSCTEHIERVASLNVITTCSF